MNVVLHDRPQVLWAVKLNPRLLPIVHRPTPIVNGSRTTSGAYRTPV